MTGRISRIELDQALNRLLGLDQGGGPLFQRDPPVVNLDEPGCCETLQGGNGICVELKCLLEEGLRLDCAVRTALGLVQSPPLEHVVPGLDFRREGAAALGGSHLNDDEASDAGRHAVAGAVLPALELEGLGPDLSIGLGFDELDVGTLDLPVQPRRADHEIPDAESGRCDLQRR